MQIPTDKIREVIGSGGKVIREIVEVSGAKVDINDDGMIKIASNDQKAIKKAYDMIWSIVAEPEEGKIYTGKVVKLVDFGAFVNFFGKRDGLVHVSQIANKRLNHPNELLKEGQEVKVKLLGFDDRGKVRLGMKMVAAAHTAERLKAPEIDQSLIRSAVLVAADRYGAAVAKDSAVPKSASLSSSLSPDLNGLVGITSVAATTRSAASDPCDPELRLDAMAGAMIQVSLSAPCNRGERIIVRHAGLSFAARIGSDGQEVLIVPALKTEALVAVYLQDSRLVLGEIAVPEAALHARFALVWEFPTELELRGYRWREASCR